MLNYNDTIESKLSNNLNKDINMEPQQTKKSSNEDSLKNIYGTCCIAQPLLKMIEPIEEKSYKIVNAISSFEVTNDDDNIEQPANEKNVTKDTYDAFILSNHNETVITNQPKRETYSFYIEPNDSKKYNQEESSNIGNIPTNLNSIDTLSLSNRISK